MTVSPPSGVGPPLGARSVALGHEHGVLCHVGHDMALALVRRLTRRDDVHDQMLNAAIGADRDLGMAPPHPREPVHLISQSACFPSSRYALDRDGILPQSGDEPVPFSWTARTACREGENRKNESFHGRVGCAAPRPSRRHMALTLGEPIAQTY